MKSTDGGIALPSFESLESIAEKVPATFIIATAIYQMWKEHERKKTRDKLIDLVAECKKNKQDIFQTMLGTFIKGFKETLLIEKAGILNATRTVKMKKFSIAGHVFWKEMDQDSPKIKEEFKHKLNDFVEYLQQNFKTINDYLIASTDFHDKFFSYISLINEKDAQGFT